MNTGGHHSGWPRAGAIGAGLRPGTLAEIVESLRHALNVLEIFFLRACRKQAHKGRRSCNTNLGVLHRTNATFPVLECLR